MDGHPAIDNDHRPASCPACGGLRLHTLGALHYAAEAVFAGNPVTLHNAPELRECGHCGSWFTANAVRAADASQLYTEGRGDEQWRTEPFAVAKRPEVVAAVAALVRRGSEVVDVGCNTGELLDFCRDHGAATTGIDLSSAARRVCAAKGHRLAPDLASLRDAADVLFAFDLVEHLYDLDGFIASALGALRSGGRMVILTGDNGSPTARAARHRWWYASYPEHVLFPSWQHWRGRRGFARSERIRTYASVGYRAGLGARLRGAARLLAGRGNGLPLIGPDHHLLVLTKA